MHVFLFKMIAPGDAKVRGHFGASDEKENAGFLPFPQGSGFAVAV